MANEPRKKITIPYLFEKVSRGEPITWLTCYDYPTAHLQEQARLEVILVGDSLGMTMLGYESTLPVTMDDMIRHTQAVRRGAPTAFVIGDMPYLSYQPSVETAIRNAGRFMAEASCHAIKEAVLANEGTVDKFLGEAVMAWFNAPLPQPDHTLRAVESALAIREAVTALHERLPEEAHLDFGVGIHYGDAVLGWIGTEKRLEYTAISDSVNTCKRLQENAAKNQILISREAYDRVKDEADARAFVPIIVKGKTHPIEVYEVLGLK